MQSAQNKPGSAYRGDGRIEKKQVYQRRGPPLQFQAQAISCVGVYLLPSPQKSEADALRSRHGDLAGMDPFALWRESERVKLALTWCSDLGAMPWLRERWDAVEAEKDGRDG